MIVEGRSDDRTWTGVPLKNIGTAAVVTRACVVLVLCCPAFLEHFISILPHFPPRNLLFYPAFIPLCEFSNFLLRAVLSAD